MTLYSRILFTLVVMLGTLNLGMGRNAQYDEEARAAEKAGLSGDARYERGNPITGIAGGVKQATYDSTAGLLSDTAQETKDGAPVVGTVEGAIKGSEKVVDNTVKGVFKVATLGLGEVDSYQKEEPKHHTAYGSSTTFGNEDDTDSMTKFKIAL